MSEPTKTIWIVERKYSSVSIASLEVLKETAKMYKTGKITEVYGSFYWCRQISKDDHRLAVSREAAIEKARTLAQAEIEEAKEAIVLAERQAREIEKL